MSLGRQQYWFNYNRLNSVVPNALITPWYNALAVKPSNALLTALNDLSQGLFDDGNWQKTDLLGIAAGMETEEQQLKPLISTSGDDFVKNGNPVMNTNGINTGGGAGYLDLKWNPTDDGSQYTLNSAFVSSFYGNDDILYVQAALGSFNSVGGASSAIFRNSTELSSYMNYDANGADPVPLIDNGVTTFFTAAVINGGNITLFKDAANNTVAAGTILLPDLDFYGGDINIDGASGGYNGNSYIRHFMAGSGTVNVGQIRARMGVFYAARGL